MRTKQKEKIRRRENLNKKVKKYFMILVVLVLLCLLIFRVLKVQDAVLKLVYPIKYEEYVYQYAEEYEVDPLLIFAIIKAESNFNPNVVSTSNAVGLMQLMDTTAAELAGKLDIHFVSKSSLYDPKLNVQLGTKYFANLKKEYNGNITLALTAYNAGIGNVKRWIEQGIIKEDGSDVENIPFKETNSYVRKIIRDYKIYQDLYNQ